MSLFSSGRSEAGVFKDTDPNPKLFRMVIHKCKQIGENSLLFINYPNCTTFDGNKIILIKTSCFMQMEHGTIDPHFFNDRPSPFARFKADDEGYKMAVDYLLFLEHLQDETK